MCPPLHASELWASGPGGGGLYALNVDPPRGEEQSSFTTFLKMWPMAHRVPKIQKYCHFGCGGRIFAEGEDAVIFEN